MIFNGLWPVQGCRGMEEGGRIEEVCGGPYVTQLDLTMDNFALGFWTGELYNIKLIVLRQMEHMKCQHFRQGKLLLLLLAGRGVE